MDGVRCGAEGSAGGAEGAVVWMGAWVEDGVCGDDGEGEEGGRRGAVEAIDDPPDTADRGVGSEGERGRGRDGEGEGANGVKRESSRPGRRAAASEAMLGTEDAIASRTEDRNRGVLECSGAGAWRLSGPASGGAGMNMTAYAGFP